MDLNIGISGALVLEKKIFETQRLFLLFRYSLSFNKGISHNFNNSELSIQIYCTMFGYIMPDFSLDEAKLKKIHKRKDGLTIR